MMMNLAKNHSTPGLRLVSLLAAVYCCLGNLGIGCQGRVHVSYTPRQPTPGYDSEKYSVDRTVSSVAYFEGWQTPWPYIDGYLNAGMVYYIAMDTTRDYDEMKVLLAPQPPPIEDYNYHNDDELLLEEEVYAEYVDALADDDGNYQHRTLLLNENNRTNQEMDAFLQGDNQDETSTIVITNDDDDNNNGDDDISAVVHAFQSHQNKGYVDDDELEKEFFESQQDHFLQDPTVIVLSWRVHPPQQTTNVTQWMMQHVMAPLMQQVRETEADFVMVLMSGVDLKAQLKFRALGQLPYEVDILMNPVLQEESLCSYVQDGGASDSIPFRSPFFLVVLDNNQEFQQLLLSQTQYMEYFEFDYDSPMTGGQILTQVYCWFVLWILVARWIKASGNTATRADDAIDSNHNGTLEASSFHLFTSEDLGRGEITQESSSDNKCTVLATPDCCAICLDAMQPGCTVCVLPCRHMFHPPCVDELLRERHASSSINHENETTNRRTICCPLCKFDLHEHFQERREAQMAILEEKHTEDHDEYAASSSPNLLREWFQRHLFWRSLRSSLRILPVAPTDTPVADQSMGDLELTVHEDNTDWSNGAMV